MCRTCGCSGEFSVALPHEHEPGHEHEHDAGTAPHAHAAGAVVRLEQRLLERNDRLAARTRRDLRARGIAAINLMSGPGAGKTTLLERTLRDLGPTQPIVVIEGDQATEHDAERVRAAGGRAIQINTGAGCHLDAAMVASALAELDPSP